MMKLPGCDVDWLVLFLNTQKQQKVFTSAIEEIKFHCVSWQMESCDER
jgi:hypothetical protein